MLAKKYLQLDCVEEQNSWWRNEPDLRRMERHLRILQISLKWKEWSVWKTAPALSNR